MDNNPDIQDYMSQSTTGLMASVAETTQTNDNYMAQTYSEQVEDEGESGGTGQIE